MAAAATLSLGLLLLEWLFWLSPLKRRFQVWTDGLGDKYYLFPFHYIVRLLALGAFLALRQPSLRPPFTGGTSLGWSVLLGLLLVLLLYGLTLKQGNLSGPAFWGKAAVWHRTNPGRFWAHAAYLTLFPGLAEELLFRWFFVSVLWSNLGWWAVPASTAVNIVWHLPIWVNLVIRQADSPRQRRAMLLALAGPATMFALVLAICTVLTQNLAGAVLAHAFGDWAGGVLRFRPPVQGKTA